MKLNFINRFIFNKYLSYKLNVKFSSVSLFKLSKIKADIVFFNLTSSKNRFILASYLLLLDFFYYKAPKFLISRIYYRGKLSTKVTVLSSFIDSSRKLNIVLEEFFYFLFLRNFDLRSLFFRNFLLINSNLSIMSSLPISSFYYTLRNLYSLALPKTLVNFTFFYSSAYFFGRFFYSFFILFFSFYLFLFEDNFNISK